MQREIYLAGGCYWGTEKFLSSLTGVVRTEVGFANGFVESPSYDAVKHTDTGHAETVHVTYDDSVIALCTLLELFYRIIDPLSVNRQGLDVGNQYRTGIYTVSDGDLAVARASLRRLSWGRASPWNASRCAASTPRRNTIRSTSTRIPAATATSPGA